MTPPPRRAKAPRSELGAAGEELAATRLRASGYRIVARNLRTRIAEIDILARRRRLWVAVEVKTRRGPVAPERTVDPRQLERLADALRALAPSLAPRPRSLRVDVVAITVPVPDSDPELWHFPGDAFPPDG
ncbi:MAG: YraN family protein [Planctomycetes bacterium]|nr:YraN family protein [Planctomycetota bacterium]